MAAACARRGRAGTRPGPGRATVATTRRWPSSPSTATGRTSIDPPPSASIARSAAASSAIEVAALPGDEAAARFEQREGELDEIGQARHGTHRDRRPAAAVAAIGGERLGPDRGRLDGRGKTGRRGHDRQEAGLLGDRFEQERTGRREGRRDRQPGIAAAGAQVDEPVDAALAQDGRAAQAVDDVRGRDRRRLADRRSG